MTRPTGLLVGLATVDVIHRVQRPPGPDEKVVATRADVAAGGPATGAAVAFAALGGTAILVTALGQGPMAALIREDLDRHQVAVVDAARDTAEPVVSSAIVVDATGERSVVSRNAEDMEVAPPDDLVDLAGSADVLVLDGHHPLMALAAAQSARDRDVPVVLDAGSWKPVLDTLLPLATMVICSSDFRLPGGREPGPVLLDRGPLLVAVTAGPDPVRWWTRHDRGVVPAPVVRAQDSLGAGDVFHGAYAHAVGAGADPVEALSTAADVAALRVSHVGPRSWLADSRLTGAAILPPRPETMGGDAG